MRKEIPLSKIHLVSAQSLRRPNSSDIDTIELACIAETEPSEFHGGYLMYSPKLAICNFVTFEAAEKLKNLRSMVGLPFFLFAAGIVLMLAGMVWFYDECGGLFWPDSGHPCLGTVWNTVLFPVGLCISLLFGALGLGLLLWHTRAIGAVAVILPRDIKTWFGEEYEILRSEQTGRAGAEKRPLKQRIAAGAGDFVTEQIAGQVLGKMGTQIMSEMVSSSIEQHGDTSEQRLLRDMMEMRKKFAEACLEAYSRRLITVGDEEFQQLNSVSPQDMRELQLR